MLARSARSRSATGLVLVVAAALFVALGPATAQEPAPPPEPPAAAPEAASAPPAGRTRWEYTFIKPADIAAIVAGQAPLAEPQTEADLLVMKQRLYAKMVEKLDELGQQGWELCGFEEDLFVLKRPVLEPPPAAGGEKRD